MEHITAAPPSEQDAAAEFVPFARSPRVGVGLLFFINGALIATWVSRIPAVQAHLGISHATLGMVLLSAALGALLAMPGAGWCASRFGSRPTCIAAAILFCFTVPPLAISPSAILLALSLFCFGAANGALDVAMNAQAVAVEVAYRRPIMSSFHALFSIGGIIGAGAGALAAAAHVGTRAHFGAATVLLGGITAVFAFPRLLRTNERGEHEDAQRTSTGVGFGWPSQALLALGAIAFCVMMNEGAVADWSAVYLKTVGGAPESLAAIGFASFSVAMAIGRLFGDSLTARFGPITLVRSGSLLSAAGIALAVLGRNPAVGILGFAAVGAGLATIVPLIFSAAGQTKGVAAGLALATTTTLGYTGFLVGPPLIGFVADQVGLRASLSMLILAALIAFALAPAVRKV